MRNALASLVLALTSLACVPAQTPSMEAHQPYSADGGVAPLNCVPNLDGQIDANEMLPAIGVTAKYLVSPQGQERMIDLMGGVDDQGHQLWDWSAPNASDQVAKISASTLDGKWYASSFPDGQFVVPIDAADTLEGVYRHTDTALELHGIASTQQNPPEGRTLLVYQQPVELYRFPITPNKSWTSTGTSVNAMLRGLPYAGTDTYEVSVDGSGIVALPDLTFTQAMRVRLKTTVAPAVGTTVTTWQVQFLAECFGEVARATSRLDETQKNFTTAAEVRRLGLPGE